LLGLCAVVCGDGSCLVLALPTTSNPREEAHEAETASTANLGAPCATSIPVFTEAQVCKWAISVPGNKIMCASWSPHDPSLLCCGMLDGTLTLWRLEMNLAANAQICLSAPRFRFSDKYSMEPCFGIPSSTFGQPLALSPRTIRSVSFCPYHPNFILSGGHDGFLKVWRTNDHSRAFYMSEGKNGYVFDAQWDPCGLGIYSVGSDKTTVGYDPFWSGKVNEKKTTSETQFLGTTKPLFSHQKLFGCIWQLTPFVADEQSFLLSASSDGSVRCCVSSYLAIQRLTSQKHVAVYTIFRLLGFESEHDELEATTTMSSSACDDRRDSRDDDWSGSVSVLRVVLYDKSERPPEMAISASSALAMHAVDCISVVSAYELDSPFNMATESSDVEHESSEAEDFVLMEEEDENDEEADEAEDEDKSNKRARKLLKRAKRPLADAQLVAYGGSSGLLRIHVLCAEEMFQH